jgi:UDP-N-acetylmuramate--alanine ligase
MSTPANGDTSAPIAAFTAETRAWFTGIGGCGMSGLARLAAARGVHVSGSDAVESAVTVALQNEGIEVTIGDVELPAHLDLLVYSAAIDEDHPHRQQAAAMGLPQVAYAQGLGLAQQGRLGVSIAGTHGKSTTAAMLAWILLDTNLDPGFIIGAHCPQLGGGSRLGAETIPSGPHEGEGGILIAEACEFNRSFHHHQPIMGLITNVEEDHLDIYGSIDGIIEAFTVFASALPGAEDGGSLLIAHDGAHRGRITPGLSCHVSTYGFHPEADYQVVFDQGVNRVGILRQGMWVVQWTTHIPGAHMAMNAAAAVILAHQLGAEWIDAAESAERFEGLDRRMQQLGDRPVEDGSVRVYDDYGHHPTEIEATLRSLRVAEDPARLVCVFQPHQHSRTRFLLDQFAQSFGDADWVIVPDIYFVRDSEAEQKKVNANDLVERLNARGVHAEHEPDFNVIVERLTQELRDGDLLVIMGAGPVWTIGRDFMQSASVPAQT